MKHLYLSLALAALTATTATAQRLEQISTSTAALPMDRIANTDAHLNRILLAGYNTLCLPFTLTEAQVEAAATGLEVERLAAINQEGATLCLYFVPATDGGIEAGVPYLVHSPKTQMLRLRTTEATTFSSRLQPQTMTDALGNRITFTSSWESLKGDGRYGIPAMQEADELQSILVPTSADKTFLPTRCGVLWEAQSSTASAIEIRHAVSLDAVTTRIANLQADAPVDVTDVRGTVLRRAVPAATATTGLPRGIYLVGGIKVAVR